MLLLLRHLPALISMHYFRRLIDFCALRLRCRSDFLLTTRREYCHYSIDADHTLALNAFSAAFYH